MEAEDKGGEGDPKESGGEEGDKTSEGRCQADTADRLVWVFVNSS